ESHGVRESDRHDGDDREHLGLDHRSGEDAEPARDQRPRDTPEGNAYGDADHYPEEDPGRRLPPQQGADLPAHEPKRSEQGEVAPTGADGNEERMDQGDGAEDDEEPAEDGRRVA